MRLFRIGITVAGLAALLAAGAARARAQEWKDILPDESLKGWTRSPVPAVDGVKPKLQWRVDSAAHTLVCAGDGQHEWLRYDQELGDFILQVEWRFTPKGPDEKRYNSGIGVRMSKSADIWFQAQTGLAGGYLFGENIADGAIKRFNLSKEMKENRVKAPGEWNSYEIRAEGPRITLSVNGEVVSVVPDAGLRRGFIGLEGEGYEITFRNLKLRILN